MGTQESYQECVNRAYSDVFDIYKLSYHRFQVISEQLKECKADEIKLFLEERAKDLRGGILFLQKHLERIAALDNEQNFQDFFFDNQFS